MTTTTMMTKAERTESGYYADIIDLLTEMVESGEYDRIGIRGQEEEFELGEIDHCSVNWIDGVETDEELDGICAIEVTEGYYDLAGDIEKRLAGMRYYPGEHLAILVSDRASYGEDENEIVMQDAEVVAIIC